MTAWQDSGWGIIHSGGRGFFGGELPNLWRVQLGPHYTMILNVMPV